jgi:hypothetical protein
MTGNDFTGASRGDGSADLKFVEPKTTVNGETAAPDIAGATISANDGVDVVKTTGDTFTDAETVFVEKGDGDINQDINTAITTASEFDSVDTVQVAAGTYEQTVTIDVEGLTLEGPNAGIPGDSNTRGAEARIEAEEGGLDAITIKDTGLGTITIDGVSVKGGTAGGITQTSSAHTGTTVNVLNSIVEVPDDGWDRNGNSIQVSGNGSVVSRNSLEVTGYSPATAPTDFSTSGILVNGASDAVVADNTVSYVTDGAGENYNGIVVGSTFRTTFDLPVAQSIEVRNNTVTEVDTGILATGAAQGTNITNNTIENNEVGIRSSSFESEGEPNDVPSGTQITDNDIIPGNGSVGVDAVADNETPENLDFEAILESNTFGRQVTVKNNAGEITENSIFAAIQPAVDAASSGDTVSAGAGTYEESITISTQNITLEGPNAGTPGYSDDRGEEAVISRTDKPGSGGAAVTITADETTVDGFQVESDAQDGISVPQAVDDVVITNNRITSVEGNTFGSGQGARATGNGIAFGLPKDTDATVTGAVVTDNEITGVTTTDLAASDDRTTANGIQVLTRDNDVERMDISGNVIRDLEPGASGDTGDSRARGIVVNVGGDGPVGEADEFNIDDNEIRNLTGDGGGGSDLAGIALFETKGVRPYVGPTNFSIEGNTIDDVANEGSGPPTALFVGGYEELGNHIVRYNNFQNGLVVRFSGDQPGFSRSEGETLNARLNWWNSTDGPAGENSSTAASGFLALDPFLTAPSDQVDKVNDEGEIITRQFGTGLSLESGVNAIAFPAPSERSLSESVNLTNVEAVYRYDNSNGGWTQLNGSDPTPSALDVYVIVVEEGETAEVVMKFENDRPENPVFESQVISGGWNLIAPTEADRSDDEAFGTQRAEISTIPPNQPFDDPSSQPYAVEDRGFSPYEGYWAFIDDDPGQSTLASNTFDGITYEEFLENADIVQLGN